MFALNFEFKWLFLSLFKLYWRFLNITLPCNSAQTLTRTRATKVISKKCFFIDTSILSWKSSGKYINKNYFFSRNR